MRTFKRLVWLWLPVLVLTAVNFYLSSQTKQSLEPIVSTGWEKPLHIAGYFVFGMALLRALSDNFENLSVRSAFNSLAVGLFLAIFDEWHQSWVPGRGNGGVADVAIDFLGISLAVTGLFGFQLCKDTVRYWCGPWPGKDTSVSD